MRSWSALTCATAFLAAGCLSANAQQNLEKVTFALGGDGMHAMAIHVANRGGLFQKEGLVLDWVDVASGPRSAAAVLGGGADFAQIGFFEVIKAAGENGQMVAFSNAYSSYPMTLVISNEALARTGVTAATPLDDRIRALKGLKIGISSPGSTTDALIRSLLQYRGMDPDKELSLQPLGAAALFPAFEKKAIDGFVWTAPAIQMAQLQNLGQPVADPLAGEVPELRGVIYSVLATSQSLLKEKPETLRKTVRVWVSAIKLIKDNPEEARRLVRQSFSKIDEQAFNLAFDQYAKGLPKSAMLTSEEVKTTIEWRRVTDKSIKDVPYEKVFYPNFARDASKSILGHE